MNLKQFSIGVALLAILAVVFGFWASKLPAPSSGTEQSQATSTPAYTEETEFYIIEAEYPPGAPAAVKADLDRRIVVFKAQVREMLTQDEQARLRETGVKYALGLEYQTFASAGYTSYLYTVYEDMGGAHPNGYFATYVFDPAGTQVQLADLFKADTYWLDELSRLVSAQVTAELKRRTNEDDVSTSLFAEGLAPKVENFSNFILDGEQLVIFIPPYQVASWAAGAFEVRIHESELRGLLR
jgi:hypothetical protein